MRIGINARNLLAKKLEGFGQYTLEITKRICEQNPQHEFILFFDRPYDLQFIFSDNVFNENHNVTIGVEFGNYVMRIDNQHII